MLKFRSQTLHFASHSNSFTFTRLTSISIQMKPIYLLLAGLMTFSTSFGQQEETYDYWAANREMIQYGVQAILTCNGLFTSNRTLEQVYEQELKYLKNPLGTAKEGPYEIDLDLKAVAIGSKRKVRSCELFFERELAVSSWHQTRTLETFLHFPSRSCLLRPPMRRVFPGLWVTRL